jgi:hypothetical protein
MFCLALPNFWKSPKTALPYLSREMRIKERQEKMKLQIDSAEFNAIWLQVIKIYQGIRAFCP